MAESRRDLNVIWFMVDSVRNYRTGEDDRDKLDIMDKVAAEAVEFTTVVTSAPSSVMSMSAMMTSCPAYYIGRDYESFKFDASAFPSLPQILKADGHEIYSIIFFREGREKLKNLFDQAGREYWPTGLKHARNYWSNDDVNQVLFNLLEGGLTEPFFLYVDYNCRLDPNTSDKVELAINRLKEMGIYDRSIFVLCSDHGYPDPRRGMGPRWFKQQGLSHDLVLTDDNILIPLYVRYPGVFPRRINTVVSSLDITPTILDILGKKVDGNLSRMMRGKSLLPLINGSGDSDEFEQRKTRVDARFLLQSRRKTALRGNRHKYILHRDTGEEEFYDLSRDSLEQHNLIKSTALADVITEFRREFRDQEEDSVQFHIAYLLSKLKRSMAGLGGRGRIQKILLFDCSQLEHIDLLVVVLQEAFDAPIIDIIARAGKASYGPESAFRHIFEFADGDAEFKVFRQRHTAITSEQYDLLLVLTQDPSAPEHKRVIRIAQRLPAREMVVVDSNMDIGYRRKRSLSMLLKVLYSKRDFYLKEPGLLFGDFFKFVKYTVRKAGKEKIRQ